MNYPIDSLGKLRITDAQINGSTCVMELDYLCGSASTTLSYIQTEKRFFIMDHWDRVASNRSVVEFEIEQNKEQLQKYADHLIEKENWV